MKEFFLMKDYNKQPTFSSFLPGLAGVHGIPIWCHYVNRGQCIASFGVEDKDHAIMEYFPAVQSYQHTAVNGFRSFVKVNGKYGELFTSRTDKQDMEIGSNQISITEHNDELGLETKVTYYTLPGERIGGLVRKIKLQNIVSEKLELEVLDGLAILIPYGVDMGSVKDMGQTAKAWMQVEDVETGIPYFRVRASMADTASVSAIAGGNFSYACDDHGNQLKAYVDPELVFDYDTSLEIAEGFHKLGLAGLSEANQVTSNQYPCSFFGYEGALEPGESVVLYQIIGQVASKAVLERYFSKVRDGEYFEGKLLEAIDLAEQLGKVIAGHTGSEEFDAYSRYTYMDNVLRGGYPVKLPGDKIFYLYSRKHGDLERDYNYFKMLPEFYSQGNGNFRDVNQNRRCDIFFSTYVGTDSIQKFYSLIQLDGYNPLSIEKITYTLSEEKATPIFDMLSQEVKEELLQFVKKSFTPGSIFSKLEELEILDEEVQRSYFLKVMEEANCELNAEFGEGYWSDHWTYNLDLVEQYLTIYPDKEQELLFDMPLTYYRARVSILPRKKRYAKTENGVRQYQFLDKEHAYKGEEKELHECFGKGKKITSNLLEKLILLCVTKYAALDAYGMGVEMEGGKPGWYDALNGMPGLFGSSMAESYELLRMMEFTLKMLHKYRPAMEILVEPAELFRRMGGITLKYRNQIQQDDELLDFWNERNDAKESYWAKTFEGISGARSTMSYEEITEHLTLMYQALEKGIGKACAGENGICPTYFTYEVAHFTEDEEGIVPEKFLVKKVPLFLEGPVRFLKLSGKEEVKKQMYTRIKNSDLYDEALQMYKVNMSLTQASYELGRAKAFTPGWLENESIWLHMEYKYLLELLKNGMYVEFYEDFKKAAIPFQDPKRYGRSIYENSSFIASSNNPNKAYRGRGFVARLSGSTVEFLQMWILMMFGEPFSYEDGELVVRFTPAIPNYLIGKDKRVEATFLGHIQTVYEFTELKDYIPGAYKVTSIELTYEDGSIYHTASDCIRGAQAKEIRDGRITRVHIFIK